MSELLQREFATHLYTHIELAEVEYATDDFEAGAFCGDLINLSDDFIVEMIDGGSPAMSGVAFEAFISCATLLKHQGFKEEREVRIVAIPGTYSLRQRLLAIHPGVPLPPINQIRTRIGRHGQSRYVRLFESLNEKLPLKRVIVGPSRNQEENTRKVLELLGSEATVTCSATPFLG
jgi:hypothetical protein